MKAIFVLLLLLSGVFGNGSMAMAQSGPFTAIGKVIAARSGHTATLLPNGRVRIV